MMDHPPIHRHADGGRRLRVHTVLRSAIGRKGSNSRPVPVRLTSRTWQGSELR